MKYPSYLVQSQNISTKSVLEVLENARNAVDDIMSSHGVVVMNAFNMLWS